MNVDITLKNYRCFADRKPATFTLKKGFTAFVGANNAGKSTILRFFYEFRNMFRLIEHKNHGKFLAACLDNSDFSFSVPDSNEMFCDQNNRDLTIGLQFNEKSETATNSGDIDYLTNAHINVNYGTNRWSIKFSTRSKEFRVAQSNVNLNQHILHQNQSENLFVGDLFDLSSQIFSMLYIGPFRNAINIGSNDNYYDIHTGQAFVQKWKEYKSGHTKEHNVSIHRLTQDIKRIFGFEYLEINPSLDETTLQLIIDGRSYKLAELGSGLAQFIVVLANAAIKKPSYILIDEPELNLHPSLQVDFLTTLASYATEGVIFTTHSIGLARATADQIYSVQKSDDGSLIKPLEETPILSEFLGELSFSGYRELGYDKILLVEGSTEMKTIQQFLRLYGKDHKIVLLPMGGGQLINEKCESELNEIKRLSDNIYALVDSEKESDSAKLGKDRVGFKKICDKLNINCHILKRRAIENYFTDDAIKRALGESYDELGHFEVLKDAKQGWAKSQNWRIAREMRKEDVDKTDLGEFLREI